MMTRKMLEMQERLQMLEKCSDSIREVLNMQIPFSKNINEIISKLGGKIEEYGESQLIWEEEKIEGKEIFIIRIAPNNSKETKNFCIACELGHLFFHTNYLEKYGKNTLEEKTKLNIYEPYYHFDGIHFAANLIMPRIEFSYKTQEYTKENKVDIKKLAKYFEVSLNSVVIRGEELGLFFYSYI